MPKSIPRNTSRRGDVSVIVRRPWSDDGNKPDGRDKTEEAMELHAPSKWMFALSLVIAIAAAVTAFTSMEFVSQQGFWVAILAYIVLALGSVASASWSD
jgi:roadblock/LC7 domain-containing protein